MQITDSINKKNLTDLDLESMVQASLIKRKVSFFTIFHLKKSLNGFFSKQRFSTPC